MSGRNQENSLESLRADPMTQVILAEWEYNPEIPVKVPSAGLKQFGLALTPDFAWVVAILDYEDGRCEIRELRFNPEGFFCPGFHIVPYDRAPGYISVGDDVVLSGKLFKVDESTRSDSSGGDSSEVRLAAGIVPRNGNSFDESESVQCSSRQLEFRRRVVEGPRVVVTPIGEPLKDLAGEFAFFKGSGIFGVHLTSETSAAGSVLQGHPAPQGGAI